MGKVALAIKGEALKQLVDLNPVVVQKILDIADHSIEDKGNNLFVWDCVKWWYNDDTIKFMKVLDEIDGESYRLCLLDRGNWTDNPFQIEIICLLDRGNWTDNPFQIEIIERLYYKV